MLTFLKKKLPLTIINLNLKNFAQKQNLKRFKKEIETAHNKDFTKSYTVNEAINKKIQEIQSKMPVSRFSKTLKIKNKQELKFSPVVEFPKNKKVFNKLIRKQIVKTVNEKEEEYSTILETRLFKYIFDLTK
jgi:hypothetical protein